MRDKSELLGLKSHELTQEEIEELGNLGLNLCDRCETVEISEELVWFDCEEFWDEAHEDKRKECENLVAKRMCQQGLSAVCNPCYDREMILEKNILSSRDMLNHLNEVGLAKFNNVAGNTSTYAFVLEQAVRDYEEEYKMEILQKVS
jgi:hypothetical protein